jgi:FAD synthetase
MGKRVIAFGTFDIFHPGHESFLKQAKSLGDYLLVVVARDKNVEKAKGRLPLQNERQRSRAIRKTKLANKVVLGSKTNNYFQTLRTHKINVIALGYDQKPSVLQLKKALKRHRLQIAEITRLGAFKPNFFKSSKLIPHLISNH